ncbi:phosphate/phosphite/phosphonate ABC transporter substrate-binding protein [Parasedimentitalea psychrophila]|uniref:PhnD/SsuA/transferrin family substrate-binding protein n=1 Tax=Parasedimentitalea psychrophila TaxID=2997337 RepID=A0A9Y2KZG4_9RHOB|nr:PhnD/SsuA/transferrin family substrate-binding protein [Parasedimentitalea psychrophila]WIY25373.1 PhnD/SsuA/transferrin family substrate-binding protein [Parasedimentitalea psychrophila]
MIAHLGMYDRPETAAANDAFWSAIQAQLGCGPETLTRGADFWQVWRSPDLLLSQTCGMPYRSRLYSEVQLVGSPDYGLPDCPPGHYNSIIVARKSQQGAALAAFDGQRFAYNDAQSQSGWAAPITHLRARHLMPGELLESGGHRASALAVAEGRADFAALDALSWLMIQRYDSFAADLVAIDRTDPTPALPYITAMGQDPKPLFLAIKTAISDLSKDHRETLQLNSLLAIPAADYLAVPTPLGPALMMHQGRDPDL